MYLPITSYQTLPLFKTYFQKILCTYHIELEYGGFVFKRMPFAGTFSLELVLGIRIQRCLLRFFFALAGNVCMMLQSVF